MYGCQPCAFLHPQLLVVVDDLDIVSVAVNPHETDAPLIIDPDAVLVPPISTEPLKPVPRWVPQIADSMSIVQHAELSQRDVLNVLRQSTRPPAREDPSRFFVTEGNDHCKYITPYVKRNGI